MEKNKFMMIIIIVLLVAMMGTIVAVSLYVLGFVQNQSLDAEGGRTPQAIRKLTIEEVSNINLGDPIRTNLRKDPDGRPRYVVFSIDIGYDNTQGKDSTDIAFLINMNITRARSLALRTAYSKSYADLDDPDGFAMLETEIKEKLQELFESSLIVDVNIYDYIIQ